MSRCTIRFLAGSSILISHRIATWCSGIPGEPGNSMMLVTLRAYFDLRSPNPVPFFKSHSPNYRLHVFSGAQNEIRLAKTSPVRVPKIGRYRPVTGGKVGSGRGVSGGPGRRIRLRRGFFGKVRGIYFPVPAIDDDLRYNPIPGLPNNHKPRTRPTRNKRRIDRWSQRKNCILFCE